MKNTVLILTIIFSGIFSTNAQENETFDLTVEVNGIKNNQGKIFIAIYDSEETFLNKTSGIIAEIKDKKSTGIFKGL